MNEQFQSLLFIGNKHETVPTRLLTDKYLTARAKLAWQLIKLNASQFQGSLFPSYDHLQYWLSDKAYKDESCSRKIVSQTLHLLRLTRWLTLCETVRNHKGQILGNVYIMNDEPLSVIDSITLNSDYLNLVEKMAKHKDPILKDVALSIIDEIVSDKSGLWHFVSHIDLFKARYHALHKNSLIGTEEKVTSLPTHLTEAVNKTQQILLSSKMELSKNVKELSQKSLSSQPKSLSSKMELSSQNTTNSLILNAVPFGNSKYSTSTNNTIKYSTVLEKEFSKLGLTPLEQQSVLQTMQSLDEQTCQNILIEVKERMAQQEIRKPVGYIFSLIREAKLGKFNPYYAAKKTTTASKAATEKKVIPASQRTLGKLDLAVTDNLKSSERFTQLAQLKQRLML
ncbi:MAG: STY4528 family pathogenicity island replication protein [[Actinobacillus] rossii]|nr:STY4528 family pathogenicity island replication protein [[Actinobacillus] rossii]MDY4506334.1 STY4528 family pathogenicity island replication protein [[Actinobacillus] rossii]